MHRQTGKQIQSVSQTDSTDRQTGRGTDRQSGGLNFRLTAQIDRRRDGQTDRKTVRLMVRLTAQIGMKKEGQTDKQAEVMIGHRALKTSN